MRILVGKTFGIGNAVMAIPMIKALQYKPDTIVDVLVGSTPDDIGAYQVLSKVVNGKGKIFINSALQYDYDVAIMAIPFDGRWRNGVDFRAKTVLDGRTRPDPSTTGLVSWKKHEVEYQMENARALGFQDFTPGCSFLTPQTVDRDSIYLGLGYKKDQAGFWKVKHWGNDNYARLVQLILTLHPEKKIVTSGDFLDIKSSIGPISRVISNARFTWEQSHNIDRAFELVSSCDTYIGNDTGMMHVAASCGRKVIGLFFMENAAIKNRPWCDDYEIIDGSLDRQRVTPDLVFDVWENM